VNLRAEGRDLVRCFPQSGGVEVGYGDVRAAARKLQRHRAANP
jgi:hypothetical protein